MWKANHGPKRARLNLVQVRSLSGAWSAGVNDVNQWIQVDLLTPHRIFRLATQGRQNCCPQWVTSFKIACSIDGVSFETVQDLGIPCIEKVFDGNIDQDTVVNNTLPVPQVCRYVRLLPLTWHGHISLRMELYGTAHVTVFKRSAVYRLVANDRALTDTHSSHEDVTSVIRCGQLCLEDGPCKCFTYIKRTGVCLLGQILTTEIHYEASTYSC
ncbi:EGF-like repeat and discoidin I-like domain-containing protein 3 [Strongylocentrotus purpuratus]|uniref:F5/8 type C domain-containing protein n=1 Tax=Strongylocentrotus purpuratus TaxID=7668 RepID=A0A7M7SXH0_STRPU|nr:EGF-like repeat and discoidin I-like domain-containing protein 3 [Strongylocentrotus purpuratus]